MKGYYFISLIIILFSLAYASCDSFEENRTEKIQGVWQRVPITNEKDIVWTFEQEGMLYRTHNDTTIDTAQYSIELKQGRYYVDVLNMDYWVNGKYVILEHNDEILVIQRVEAEYGGAFLRREFVKL